MKERVSVDECRAILGASADTMTDAEIEAMRDELERTADVLSDQMVEVATMVWWRRGGIHTSARQVKVSDGKSSRLRPSR